MRNTWRGRTGGGSKGTGNKPSTAEGRECVGVLQCRTARGPTVRGGEEGGRPHTHAAVTFWKLLVPFVMLCQRGFPTNSAAFGPFKLLFLSREKRRVAYWACCLLGLWLTGRVAYWTRCLLDALRGTHHWSCSTGQDHFWWKRTKSSVTSDPNPTLTGSSLGEMKLISIPLF